MKSEFVKSERVLKKGNPIGATLCLKSQIQYKRLLKKRMRKGAAGSEEGKANENQGQIKIEESFADDTCNKPWLLDKRESEICFESMVKKIDYDSLEVLLYKN